MDSYNAIGVTPLIDYMDGADVDNWLLDGSQDLSPWKLYHVEDDVCEEQLDGQSAVANSSSGRTGVEVAESRKNKDICEEMYQQLSNGMGNTLAQLIEKENFDEEDLLHAFLLFDEILTEYPYLYNAWLTKLYNKVYDSDVFLSRFLSILAEFADREDFSYIASLFAKAELNNRSYDVVDMAMSVIDNLPHKEAKRVMETINPPQDIILRLKYEAILKDLNS